jgi:hypothetical protein
VGNCKEKKTVHQQPLHEQQTSVLSNFNIKTLSVMEHTHLEASLNNVRPEKKDKTILVTGFGGL